MTTERLSSGSSRFTRNKTSEHDFSHETWLSLLGLLNPLEFVITVNSFPIWRRHLAWAKPDGKELRDIMTLRFSSTMVLLSLLLGSEMAVLFSPNKTTTAIRDSMDAQAYKDFKFWIGVTIWISACVTVVGIIATFSAWGMVASISAENAHCLLRSSIGQYVSNLPASFVVASLYLFLFWLILFMFLMMKGISSCILFIFAAYLFFIVVVPLSAFGRLIMHTGAMSSTKVLEPDLEKRLLPSGLHASLLIKAMHRKHTRTSAVTQYRTTSMMKAQSQGYDDVEHDLKGTSYGSTGEQHLQPAPVKLPRPSVLNTMHSNNLRSVVERVLWLQHSNFPTLSMDDEHSESAKQTSELPNRDGRSVAFTDHADNMTRSSGYANTLRHRPSRGARNSLSNLIRGQLKRASRNQVLQEWDEENDIREIYDLPPPAEVEEDDEEDIEDRFDLLYSVRSAAVEGKSGDSQNLLHE